MTEHTVKAFTEAEAYPGPAIIIAYSHCIAHGYDLKIGTDQQKLAVESGVWPLYRYDPRLVETGKGAGSGSRLSRSPGRINLGEIYRAVETAEPFARPSGKPNDGCPVGHCIRKTLDKVFESAQSALEQDLKKTTLAGVIEAVKASGNCGKKTV